MVQAVGPIMADLDDEDFYLLSGVEQGMRFSEWVDRDRLPSFSNLTAEEVDHRLDRCEQHGLIERKTIQYEGWRLTFEGYDALALHTFAERETIEAIGAPLGVGKESDVYEVKSYRPLACKLHREGVTNFREVNRGRDYTSENEHVSWMYTARKAAEREYEIIETLYPDVAVPRPIDQNRHAFIMDKMDGVALARATLPDEQVTGVLELILRELQGAYERGYIHGDISEHNIFVADSGITVFDWPQAVTPEHENAREILERDLTNLLGYFDRKYPGKIPSVRPPDLADTIEAKAFESLSAMPVSERSG